MFAIATLQDRDIQALFVTYLAQTLGPKVGLEWTDHYATQYNLRTGWPLNSEPVCRSGSWTPKESLPPILPQLKVELHDDQTFLMEKCILDIYPTYKLTVLLTNLVASLFYFFSWPLFTMMCILVLYSYWLQSFTFINLPNFIMLCNSNWISSCLETSLNLFQPVYR